MLGLSMSLALCSLLPNLLPLVPSDPEPHHVHEYQTLFLSGRSPSTFFLLSVFFCPLILPTLLSLCPSFFLLPLPLFSPPCHLSSISSFFSSFSSSSSHIT